MNVNQSLKNYIEQDIMPEYSLNDKGHNQRHIGLVMARAFELAENYDINQDMLFAIVSYHDIACHINREKHEILSAERLSNDNNLRGFFNEEQMGVMKEAVEDHRASLEYEPRNIYGKILSSADRKVDVTDYLMSSMGYEFKKNPNATDEELFEHSYNHAIKKFGKNGYAVGKFYIEDKKYRAFLDELQWLIDNKSEFIKRAKDVVKMVKGEEKIKLVLASGSKQRQDIFDMIGLKYEVRTSKVDEDSDKEDPAEYVKELSLNKAISVADELTEKAVIVSADTIIYFDGKFYEKPKSKQEAFDNIRAMSGKINTAYTGLTIKDTYKNITINFATKVDVKFREISDDEIEWYVENEPKLLKCCGYVPLGKGAIFVESVSGGDYNTLMGVSPSELVSKFKELGYSITDFEMK